MGLIIDVYRNARGTDCTNNGISSKANGLCLVNVEGPFNPSAEYPAAMLVHGNLPGTVKIVPAEPAPAGGWQVVHAWFMMGGNYGSTSDSRFNQACARITGHNVYCAVPIHDRQE